MPHDNLFHPATGELAGKGLDATDTVFNAASVDAAGWRILAGERWWQPHVSHVYQRWVRTGRSHAFVTGVYAMFSIGAVILAAFLYQAAPWSTGGGVALWFLVAITIWLGMRRRLVPRKVNPSSA